MLIEAIRNEVERLGLRQDSGERLDAIQTAFIEKQLEYVFTSTYDVQYAELMARRFIPFNTEVPSGANSYTYYQWDEYGMAEIITNYADDLPVVGEKATEFNAPVRSLGDAYVYSTQDLRAAAFAKQPLDSRRAAIARRVIEAKVDELAALGDARAGLKGFLNHTNVPLVSLTTGTWSGATPTQILADLRKVQSAIITNTKQIYQPDTLLLDTDTFDLLSNTVMSVDNSDSILATFLKNSPSIKNIDQWWRLNEADAAGTGPRLVMYTRNPEVAEFIMPLEFEQHAPQANNLAFKVPCEARAGGMSIRYPLAMAYADGM